jgi:SAM-dependent methyltransferase
MAVEFDTRYGEMVRNRFASSFSYGRAKIDRLLDAELKTLEPGAVVLDVGCGTGVYLKRLADLGFRPRGVEPAEAMLDRARAAHPDVSVTQGVATALPERDASVDAVLAIEVYRYLHLEDTRLAFREAARVLRPGGVFFFTMVNRWALDGFYLVQHARCLLKRRDFDRRNPHCEFVTPTEVRRELTRAGFTRVRTVGRLFGPIRLLYRVHRGTAARVARWVETLDDLLHASDWSAPLAGHLVVTARRT